VDVVVREVVGADSRRRATGLQVDQYVDPPRAQVHEIAGLPRLARPAQHHAVHAHVDGIRIDSAAVLIKDPDAEPDGHDPYTDRDGVHEVYRNWRKVSDEYSERILIGEVWLPDAARLARYVGPGELNTVFNFPYLDCPWDAAALRRVIDSTLALAGAPATWVLSNHDVDRVVSRYRLTICVSGRWLILKFTINHFSTFSLL